MQKKEMDSGNRGQQTGCRREGHCGGEESRVAVTGSQSECWHSTSPAATAAPATAAAAVADVDSTRPAFHREWVTEVRRRTKRGVAVSEGCRVPPPARVDWYPCPCHESSSPEVEGRGKRAGEDVLPLINVAEGFGQEPRKERSTPEDKSSSPGSALFCR